MDKKKFLLRLDPKIWQEIESWAQTELRSVNGQIEYILTQAIKQRTKKFLYEPVSIEPPE